ncbi:MAG: outer membrane protein assembly factor BamB family protein, partial [Planctomycetota bacterium]
LGEILVRRHKISSTQLQEALEKQKETGALLGEILIFQGIVSEQEIEDSVRSQIEEIIYDVFSWKDAKFEFIAGEPLEEFFDQTATGRKITFNISGIIMEAARRIDEWDLIHQEIPTMSSIYASAVDKPTFDPDQADYPQKMVLEILGFVDGVRSVEDICEESPHSAFETSKIVAFLIKTEQLRPLTPSELLAAGFRLREEGKLEDAVAIYHTIVESEPSDEAAREALAEIYGRLGRHGEAGDEFAELGRIAKDAGEDEKAFKYIKKAAELSPKNFEIHSQLFDMYISKERWEDAGKEAVEVAKNHWHKGKHHDARNVLELLLKAYPQHIESRQLLINILIEQNDKAGIVKNYEALAREYGSRNELTKVLQIYEKIILLEPHRKDLKSKLDSLKEPRARKKRMPAWAKVFIVLLILILLLAGGGAGWIMLSNRAEEEYAGLVEKLDSRLDGAIKEAEEKEKPELLQKTSDEVCKELEDFKQHYWWSRLVLLETRIGSKRSQLETLAREKKKALEERLSNSKSVNERLNAEAENLYLNGKYEESLAKYGEVDLNYLPERARDAIEQRMKEMGDYLAEAKSTLIELNGFESEIGKATDKATKLLYVKSAFEAAQRLYRYNYAAERKLVKFPLYLETQPPGASVAIDGNPHGERTPTVIHYGMDAPAVKVGVEKSTFHSRVLDIKPKIQSRRPDGWRYLMELAKKRAWLFEGKAKVQSDPVAYGSVVLSGNLDGKLHLIRSGDGEKIWEFDPEEALAEFYAEPLVVKNMAFIPGTNKYCYALDLNKRTVVWKQLLPSPVRHAPVAGSGRLFIATERSLHALDLDNGGSIVWSAEIEGAGRRIAVTSPPVLVGENVVIGMLGGVVRAYSVTDGNAAWSFTLPAEIAGTIVKHENLVLALCDDESLYALNPAGQGQKEEWSFKIGKLAGGRGSRPVIAGSRIYVGTGDKWLKCIDCSAKPVLKWQHKLPASLQAAPVVSRKVIYVITSDNAISSIVIPKDVKDPAVDIEWQVSLPQGAEIVGAALVYKTLVVALRDGILLAFEE